MASEIEISKSNNLEKNINQLLIRANRIHLELLSSVENELNKKKKNIQNFIIYSINDKIEINKEDKDIEILRSKNTLNSEHKSDTSYNSDYDEDGEESSSEMSCFSEECIINYQK